MSDYKLLPVSSTVSSLLNVDEVIDPNIFFLLYLIAKQGDSRGFGLRVGFGLVSGLKQGVSRGV